MSDAISQASPFGSLERSLAWRYIRAKREHGGASLISIISFIGIMLAVAALIITMSIMNGFRGELTNSLIGGQGHMFVTVDGLAEAEALDIGKQIAAIDGVDAVMPLIQSQSFARGRGGSSGALVRGVRPEDLEKYPPIASAVLAGEYGEGSAGGNVIFVGIALARELGVGPGDTVNLISPSGNKTVFGDTQFKQGNYRVGGYIQTGNFELDRIYIFMPLERAQVFFNSKNNVQMLDMRLDDFNKTDDMREKLATTFGNRFLVSDWKQQNGAYLSALQTESGVMRMIMLILITITSLNIITGVVMLVKNKAGDIAILRTIGATRGSMMRVFIMIGGMLGLVGALIGLMLGVLFVVNIGAIQGALDFLTGRDFLPQSVYVFESLPAKLNIWEAIGTTGWAMLMSMLVTIWPAWLAAKTDPIEALRFE